MPSILRPLWRYLITASKSERIETPRSVTEDRDIYEMVLNASAEDHERLWCLGKQLKQGQESCYIRAIRILLYHDRAQYHYGDKIKYLKKCIAIDLPTCSCCDWSRVADCQATANRFLDEHASHTPTTSSRTSLFSSQVSTASSYSYFSSSAGSRCGNCGIEKRAMPVCARCRSQVYCSYRCLVAHQPVHERDCLGGNLLR